ncbi:MAG TPA: hypothetical protein VK174_06620 [Chitinophagales bacterium]|nr:hypothetical protein [Chitinophagales bacterium]
MIAVPLLILALAAGVFLLIKVKRDFLGGVFETLAWLVIVLSLVAIGFAGFRAFTSPCHGEKCGRNKPECHMEKQVIINKEGGGHCSTTTSMAGCTMEGDSVVMDQAVCEKMMGKEACEAMRKERGRCIVSKEECMEKCKADGKPCCAGPGHGEKPMCNKPQQ